MPSLFLSFVYMNVYVHLYVCKLKQHCLMAKSSPCRTMHAGTLKELLRRKLKESNKEPKPLI